MNRVASSLSLTLNINGIPYELRPTAEPYVMKLLKQGATVPYLLRLLPGLRIECSCPDAVQGHNRCKHAYSLARTLLVLACTMSGKIPPAAPSLEFPADRPESSATDAA